MLAQKKNNVAIADHGNCGEESPQQGSENNDKDATSCDIKLKPGSRWREDEDTKLLDAVQKHGRKFTLISEIVFGGDRSRNACSKRYKIVSDSHLVDVT